MRLSCTMQSVCVLFVSIITFVMPHIAFGGVLSSGTLPSGRTYHYQLPPQIWPNQPMPLVLVLHGGSLNSLNAATSGGTQYWRTLADQQMFFVVYPQAATVADCPNSSPHWNDCRNDAELGNSTTNDVQYIIDLIEKFTTDYNIDRRRVYVTGVSNGGMMTYRLAIEIPGRLAGVAAFIANLPLNTECGYPALMTSAFICNGTSDSIMTYGGGYMGSILPICVSHPGNDRGSVASSLTTRDVWLTVNGIGASPITYNYPNINPSDGSTVHREWYLGGGQNTEIQYLRVQGGGHAMPSIAHYSNNGVMNGDIEGAREAWTFLKRFTTNSTIITDGSVPVAGDFDGDGKTDLGAYRALGGRWIIWLSTSAYKVPIDVTLGGLGQKPVVGDYNGDGISDVAVYNQSIGTWSIIKSGVGLTNIQFGWSAANPVPADYDGDGKTDLAVYHPAAGMWYIMQSTLGYRTNQFGWSAVNPYPADYDGDGKADIAGYYPALGEWYIMQSTLGYRTLQYGWSASLPVPADYDGDNKADIAVYDPAAGNWHIVKSSNTNNPVTVQWGGGSAIAIPANYTNSVVKDSICVYLPSDANWFIRPPL